MSKVLFWLGISAIGLATLSGWFPLWKSATLSPDTVQRITYWTGCGLGLVLLFLSQAPDWRSGAFLSVAFGLGLVGVAFNWTNHIKIRGRIFAAFANLREPDRPPALNQSDSEK
ncbi:hypothetical protein [Mycolicibacterium palauense]|uniref:hypothetical protein n=1 Tax=Mycolicibacterium palauense TaxID=2034511 RepID=UPI0011460011|nr:hypothetical protein [Mycolicibacterium palauense]